MMIVGMAIDTAMVAASLPPLNAGSVFDCCAEEVDDCWGGECDVSEEAVEELKLLVLPFVEESGLLVLPLAEAPVSLMVEAPPLKWKISL